MTNLDLTDKFWNYLKDNPVNTTSIVVYLYLVRIWESKSQKAFDYSDIKLSQDLNLSRITVINARNILCKIGLINCTLTNGKPALYDIKINFNFSDQNTSVEKNNSLHQKPSIRNTHSEPKANSKTSNQNTSSNQNLTQSLQAKEVVNIPQPTPKKPLPENIPTLEEFQAFARTVEIYNVDMDFLIKTKYEDWIDRGWKTASNKKITNWKISLKTSMAYMSPGNNSFTPTTLPKIKRPKQTYNE